MDKIFNKQKLLTGILLVGFIVVLEWLLHHFQLPTWPVFMVMVLMFLKHQDPKETPNILVGGAFGIANLIILKLWMGLTAPSLGLWESSIAYVAIFVFCIVLFMDVLPILFNSHAFMYFLVAAVAAAAPAPNPVLWIGCEIIGGLVVVGGLMVINKVIAAIVGPALDNH